MEEGTVGSFVSGPLLFLERLKGSVTPVRVLVRRSRVPVAS